MLLNDPVAVVGKEKRAVGQDDAGRRFKIVPCVIAYGFEKPDPVVVRCDREVDEHHGVAGMAVSFPGAIASQFLKCFRHTIRITVEVEPHPFEDCRDNIANVSRHYITAGICNPFAPFVDTTRSERFPVPLQNAYASFTLVDLDATV